jgi:hypothetical protein
MIARRRAAFLRLCAILRSIEADLDNFDAVRTLNIGVLKEILRDEAHIQRLRGLMKEVNRRLKTERPSKAESAKLRRQIKRHEHAIERYAGQLFIWRCLADGLVYAYLPSANVKHAYFDTTSTAAKPKSGFIGGKSGLPHEIDMLLSAIEHRVPAVLSDITNIIRYGDVCLLGASDPYPMEVKAGSVLNQRGRRQAAKLAELRGFLDTDQAPGFRGMPEMRRVDYGIPHQDCIEDLNLCIQTARRDGWNAVCPEQGLVYIAVFDGFPVEDVIGNIGMTLPVWFMPNAEKDDQTWAPYLPFTNSIRDPVDLYDFVVGKLSLFVVVDAAVACDDLAMPGWTVSLVEDVDRSILLEHRHSDAKIAISSQFFGRLGLEFMSLASFVLHEKEAIAHMWAQLQAGEGQQVDPAAFGNYGAALEALPRAYEASGD